MSVLTAVTVPSNEVVHLCARFIKKHSWGEDYPYDPANLLANSEYLIVAIADEGLLGMACVTRHEGEPSNPENTDPFFCCWAVHADHRRKGIGLDIYAKAIAEARRREYPYIFATTDSEDATRFLCRAPLKLNEPYVWLPVKPGKNEDGSPHVMLEYLLTRPA